MSVLFWWHQNKGAALSVTGSGTPILPIQVVSGAGTITITGSGGVTVPLVTVFGRDVSTLVDVLDGSILFRKTYDQWQDQSGLSRSFNINDHAYKVLIDLTGLSKDHHLNDLMKHFLVVNRGLTGVDINDLLDQWDLAWA